jgi:hypothetical protein
MFGSCLGSLCRVMCSPRYRPELCGAELCSTDYNLPQFRGGGGVGVTSIEILQGGGPETK